MNINFKKAGKILAWAFGGFMALLAIFALTYPEPMMNEIGNKNYQNIQIEKIEFNKEKQK